MREKMKKKQQVFTTGKRCLALLLSMAVGITSADFTVLAYPAEKAEDLAVTDREGNEKLREDTSWEEKFPNGTFAFKNEYISLQESPEPETQKITVYRLGGTAGEATARIAVSPVVSYLDEAGTEAVYANAAGNSDYILQVEEPAKNSENGEITYTPVDLDQEDVYGTGFFELAFEEGEWVKDVLITPVDDEEHESQELALLTIYEVEGAEFTETANRSTVSIGDDEEILPSEMGFDAESVRVDKAEHKAVIRVKRTGALQYVNSVEYRTEDDTAKAGTDYVAAAGTASFSGDFDYFDIQIDLIDNKEVSHEDLSFRILLSEPRGGTIREDGREIRVDLYNSATSGEDNLATRLQSPQTVDLTAGVSTQEKAVTENRSQVVTQAEKSEDLIPIEYTSQSTGGKKGRSQATAPSPIEIGKNEGNWRATETDPLKVGTWTRKNGYKNEEGKEEGTDFKTNPDGAELKTDYNAYMSLNIPGIANRFQTLDWKVDCSTRKTLYWAYNYLSATYGALGTDNFAVLDRGGTPGRGDDNMDAHLENQRQKYSSDIKDGKWLFTFRGDQAHGSGKGYDEGSIRISDSDGKYDNLVFKIRGTYASGNQRPRYGRIKLYDFKISRRTLRKNPSITVVTPDDDDNLEKIINMVKPEVSLVAGAGGTDGQGKLYYGSTLKVRKSGTAGQYEPVLSELTTQSGTPLWSETGSNVELQLADRNQQEKRLNEDLKIVTYLERSQNFQVSYKSSILEEDTPEEIEAKKARIMSRVTYRAKQFDSERKTFQDTEEIKLSGKEAEGQKFVTELLKNVKSVNFHLDDGSMILYNGQAYGGDTDIPIASEDYNRDNILFSFYTPDAVSVERDPQILSINSVRLYADRNDDGKYTEKEDGSDYEMAVTQEAVCMDELKPVDGHGLLMVVDYTYSPACISVPPGADKDAEFSVIPSFVTTLTEEGVKEDLTEEMQNYRDIESQDGTAVMYKEDRGTISVPLGYDASPAVFNEKTGKYEWTPEWRGYLRKNFENPQKVVLDNTWMPNGFVAAGEKDEINGYLGCLQGNDTLVLSSRLKEKVTSVLAADFYTYPEMGAQTFDQTALPGVDAPEDDGGVTDNLPDAADTSPSVELPNIEIELGPLTYMMGEDEIGFSVGVPLTDGDPEGSREDGQEQLNQLKKAYEKMNVFQKLRERSRRNGPDHPGFEGGNMRGKSNEGSFEMAASATFMWKYSQKTASYEFSQAMVAVAVSGDLKFQYRFSACPIFYVYLCMGGEMNMSTGLEVEVEIDEQGNKRNQVAFAGMQMEPSVFIEAGAGVGIDIARLEVYVHVSVSMAMSIGEEDLSFDKFETGAAVGFNAVFLFFSFKMDLVGCTAGYDKELEGNGKDGWYFKWSAFGREMKSRAAAEAEPPEIPGARVTLELPRDTGATQEFFTSDDNVPADIMPFAFDLENMPFQTSGYGGSAAAVKLADGLNSAADYQLLTVGDKNYLLYTISRSPNETGRNTDLTQIVLSELTTTGSSGEEAKGLANPVDPEASRPYIPVDLEGDREDPYGDLEFDAYVEDGRIQVVWTSYTETSDDEVDFSGSEQQILAQLSRHVSVKQASFTPGTDTAFTPAGIAAEETPGQGYRFLPRAVNDSVFCYTEAKPYTREELQKREEAYKAYYQSSAEGNEQDGSGGTGDPYANANYQYALTMDELYGQYSGLKFAVKKEDGNFEICEMELPAEWKDQETRIDYVRFTDNGDNSFYMAYATSQEVILGEGENQDRQTVKKLYLQKAELQNNSPDSPLKMGTPVMIKTLVDSDLDDGLDGEYQGGALTENCTAPTFSNLKFLKGRLSAQSANPETIFLFGMNGMTYVIDEKNLTKICAGEPGAEMKPFFVKDENGNSQSDTVIGADGDGNISAVYTDTAPNTVNNALYVTKFDPTAGEFGQGTMLAMNHMQVYEDAQAGSWSPEDTKEAYFDENRGGGMDKFTFAKPQIAIGTPTTEEKQGTLTIVTQGTFTNLVKTTMQKPDTQETVEEIIPDMTDGISGRMGVYAITYGIGKQDIGEESIRLAMEEFAPGAVLSAGVSFRNTGDVAIRAAGGANNEGTIKLYAGKADGTEATELASWKLLSNVLAGQEVVTDMVKTRPLPDNIQDLTLYFTVSENVDYIGEGAFSASTLGNEDQLGTIAVGEQADVKITQAEVQAGFDMKRENVNGQDSAVVDIDLELANQGFKDAKNIRILLERTDGKDESGENRYIPLNLDRTLVEYTDSGVAGQEGTALTGPGQDGIYQVIKAVDQETQKPESVDSIKGGESIRLKGKITLPVSCFDRTSPGEAMNLRFTVLTDTGEYTKENNEALVTFAPVTVLSVPSTVNLTLGNTVNFEVPYTSAASRGSNICAVEMAVSSGGEAGEATADQRLLDVLSYNSVNGMITVRAGREGSGIIRIADTTTNSYRDLVFINTADGTNISVENQALTFKNSGQGAWEDKEIGKITEEAVLPYNHDLCVGKKEGSFTFTTYASSLELYFDGKVEVSSKNSFGFGSEILEGSGKSTEDEYYEPVVVDFKNTDLKKHEVTITVLGERAEFDKLVEKYGTEGDIGDIVEKDTIPPVILPGKSLPASGSLKTGVQFCMPVYIYDNMALNSVSIDGGGADTYVHQGFAQGTLTVTENRRYRIIAVDACGNRASYDLDVDWFDPNVSAEAAADTWPMADAWPVTEDGNRVEDFTGQFVYLRCAVAGEKSVERVQAYRYDPQTNTSIPFGEARIPQGDVSALDFTVQGRDGNERITKNGYYRIEVTAKDGSTSQKLVYVNVVAPGPEVNLYRAVNQTNGLFYSAGSQTNQVALAGLAIYKGKVEQTSSGSIEVEGAEAVLKKDYSRESGPVTWDTGTIELAGSNVYTIMVKDVTGGIGTFVYSDNSSLSGLAVHDADYQLEMETFSPYQYEYHVLLPYGYPENQLPAVKYQISGEAQEAGATASVKTGEDRITVTLTYKGVDTDYVVLFEREVCTCGIELTAYENFVTIPYGQDTVDAKLSTRIKVLPCTVKGHETHTEEKVKYSYEILEGESFLEIGEDGTVTYGNFPGGSTGVSTRVAITAYTDTASAQAEAVSRITREYRLHLETAHCGHIESGGRDGTEETEPETGDLQEGEEEKAEIILPSEDGSKETDFYLNAGENYQFQAVADEGCVFRGWANENGEITRADAGISGKLLTNLTLRAVFEDVTPPEAKINLKTLENPEAGEGTGDILYAKEGITVTLTGEDAQSGVKSIQYQLVEAGEEYDEKRGWLDYTEPVVLTEDIFAVVYARVEDRDGNVTVVHSREILIDKEGGKLMVTPSFTDGEWTRQEDAQIHVLAMEGVSPIKRITYIVDGKACLREEKQFVISDLKDGDYEVKVIAEDKAGHRITETVQVKKETQDTTIRVTGNPTEPVREAVLRAEVTTGVSGLKEILVNGEKIEGNTYELKESQNGTYVFTAVSHGGSSASVTVEVTNMINRVEEIWTDREQISLAVGKTDLLDWKVLPENVTYPQVTFTSSDKTKAVVDDKGLITALAEGEAVITIASADNPAVKKEVTLDLFEEYRLHVTADTGGEVEYQGKTLDLEAGKTDLYLRKGTEYTLTAKPLEGYEFTGWTDGEKEPVQKEAVIKGTLLKDRELTADFRDNIPPEGEILLEELESPKQAKMPSGRSGEEQVSYSRRGYLVTIQSSDKPGGIRSVKYQVVNSAEAPDEIRGWKDYEKPFRLEEEGNVKVYARLEDKDGNVTLIHSGKIVIEHTVPIQAETEHWMTLGQEWQVQWQLKSQYAPYPKILFETSDGKTASVTETGVVTAKKAGTAVITLRSGDDGQVLWEIQVKIRLPRLKVKAKSDRKILLTWEGAAGAEKYLVYRANKKNGKYRKIAEVKESAYRDKKAKSGKSYYYKVQAIGETEQYNGPHSSTVRGKACLRTPENVRVAISGRNYKIRWSKSPGAKSYVIYRSAKAGGGYRKIGTTERSSYTDRQSGRKKKWYYRVRAVGKKSRWNSALSRGVACKKKTDLKKVKASVRRSSGQVQLSWKKVSQATGYQIYRGESRWGIFRKMAETEAVNFWTDETVEGGKTYYYKVRAVARKGKQVKKTGYNSKIIRVKVK